VTCCFIDQGRQQTLSTLEEVEGAAGPSTIILQTTDGSGHMIVTHQGLEDQNSSVSQLQQHMVDMKAAGSLHSAVNSIDVCVIVSLYSILYSIDVLVIVLLYSVVYFVDVCVIVSLYSIV